MTAMSMKVCRARLVWLVWGWRRICNAPHRETAEDVGRRSCPICCLAPGGDALWTWPCSCHLDLHLNSAMEMRVRDLAIPGPRCPHCRMEWPGDAAGRQLIDACESTGVPFIRNWQQLPAPADSGDLVMPHEPHDLVLLCCEQYITMNITGPAPHGMGTRSKVCR